VLQAVSAPGALPPLFDLRGQEHNDSNELPPSGRLAPELIQGVVRKSYGRFRKCYEAGLARSSKLEGRVSVRFVIALDGSVRENEVESQTLPDPDAVRCVVESFAPLQFPSPVGGIVTVVYPLMFTPG